VSRDGEREEPDVVSWQKVDSDICFRNCAENRMASMGLSDGEEGRSPVAGQRWLEEHRRDNHCTVLQKNRGNGHVPANGYGDSETFRSELLSTSRNRQLMGDSCSGHRKAVYYRSDEQHVNRNCSPVCYNNTHGSGRRVICRKHRSGVDHDDDGKKTERNLQQCQAERCKENHPATTRREYQYQARSCNQETSCSVQRTMFPDEASHETYFRRKAPSSDLHVTHGLQRCMHGRRTRDSSYETAEDRGADDRRRRVMQEKGIPAEVIVQ
jgi:hypothetical protein